MRKILILLSVAAMAPILPFTVGRFFLALSLLLTIVGVSVAAVVKIALFVYSRRVMR